MDFEEWSKASKWGGETWINCIKQIEGVTIEQIEGVNVKQIANQQQRKGKYVLEDKEQVLSLWYVT